MANFSCERANFFILEAFVLKGLSAVIHRLTFDLSSENTYNKGCSKGSKKQLLAFYSVFCREDRKLALSRNAGSPIGGMITCPVVNFGLFIARSAAKILLSGCNKFSFSASFKHRRSK